MSKLKPLALAVLLACSAAPAVAQERESLELLRTTTMNLIDALVEAGVITREKADALVKDAERRAAREAARGNAASGAVAGAAAGAAAGATTTTAVRVPYVPESVKNEIRDQVKNEVLAQARNERWAEPNAYPSWLDRIQPFGDLRVRYQFDNFASDNTPPIDYWDPSTLPGTTTRDPDLADNGATDGNTREDISRMRLRARFGFNARLSESASGTLRVATGSTNDPVSTNVTLGEGFNKYAILLDRAAIRYAPWEWMQVDGGRMANPWQSAEIMWDEDLSFDGLAMTFKRPRDERFMPFATFGVMPLSASKPASGEQSRTLLGWQLGAQWALNSSLQLRGAIAQYNFKHLEGRREPDAAFDDIFNEPVDPATYGASALPSQYRQRGNTYARINAANDTGSQGTPTKWGLASKFKPVHIGLGLNYSRYDPFHVVLTADYVNNTAFDRSEIRDRTGLDLRDGSNVGYQFRVLVGQPDVRRRHEWNASIAFRRVGSDAVPDGFTDSDLGLGGTNLRGFTIGGNYGLDENTWLGLRYLSAKNIDSPTSQNYPNDKYAVDSVQVDLNMRF